MTCGDTFDVGDAAVIVFRFQPVPQHPLAESTGFTVTLHRPDGSTFGTYSAPDPALSSATHHELIDGVSTLITEWTFEMPTPFDVGSRRNPWIARGVSTAGIMAAVAKKQMVNPAPF